MKVAKSHLPPLGAALTIITQVKQIFEVSRLKSLKALSSVVTMVIELANCLGYATDSTNCSAFHCSSEVLRTRELDVSRG